MSKKVVIVAFLIFSLNLIAQKAQRFGYIDMEYILENIPEYTEAQAQISTKASSWQNTIQGKQNEIDNLKADLRNEQILLTKDLIEEREEDIEILEIELKKLQATLFGAKGELFLLRQQLVQPIQDLVYNSVQEIAKKRKYDFVLDKSSDLIMLYTNKQFDISDLVINSISRTKKTTEINARRNKNISSNAAEPIVTVDEDVEEPKSITSEEATVEVSEEVLDKAKQKEIDREARRAELLRKIEEKKAAQLKKREELLKANEEKRQERLKQIEEAKKAKENKNN